MTLEREEAIGNLEYAKRWKDRPTDETIDMAIKAIEQEPCEDWYDVPSDEMTLKQARQAVKDLRQKLAECLEQQPCEDAISRQAVEEITWEDTGYTDSLNVLAEVRDKVRALPPVTPQPKMEKWKIGQWKWEPYDRNSKFGDIKLGDWHCSECGSVVSECVYKDEKRGIPFYKYCPQCGAKMREVNADADSD